MLPVCGLPFNLFLQKSPSVLMKSYFINFPFYGSCFGCSSNNACVAWIPKIFCYCIFLKCLQFYVSVYDPCEINFSIRYKTLLLFFFLFDRGCPMAPAAPFVERTVSPTSIALHVFRKLGKFVGFGLSILFQGSCVCTSPYTTWS